MTTLSKLVTLAILAAGTALISAASPSAAQGVPCCVPEAVMLGTNATWNVAFNANSAPPPGKAKAVVLNKADWPYTWSTPPANSQWIGHARSDTDIAAAGYYTYSTTFCLCQLPPNVDPKGRLPAALSLSVLADNAFVAKLNNGTIGKCGVMGTGSQTCFLPPVTNIPSSATAPYLKQCGNTLSITVWNDYQTPTGLAASVSLSGYIQQVSPNGSCPCT
jgi:hypothetical protein